MLLKTQILINTLVNFVAITILVADAAEGAIIVVSDDLIIEEIVEIIFPSLDISLMPPMDGVSGGTPCRPQHQQHSAAPAASSGLFPFLNPMPAHHFSAQMSPSAHTDPRSAHPTAPQAVFNTTHQHSTSHLTTMDLVFGLQYKSSYIVTSNV